MSLLPFANAPGSGGLSIGTSVGSGTDNRLLYIDGSGNLADAGLNMTTQALAGSSSTVPMLTGADYSLPAFGHVGTGNPLTNIGLISFDATALGGTQTMGLAMTGSALFALIDPTTFQSYFQTIVTSGTAQFSMNSGNSNGIFDLTTSGTQLGGTGARITSISDDTTMAANSATLGVTQHAVKQYVLANLSSGTVASVNSGTGIFVDNTIPSAPIVNNLGVLYQNWGVTINNTGTTSSGSSRARVSPVTLTSGGSLISGTLRVWVSGSTQRLKHIIYADNAGVPGAFVAVSDQVTISNTAEQAITFTYSGTQQKVLPPGNYWIGYINEVNSNTLNISDDTTTNGNFTNNITYPTYNDPFGGGSAATGIIDTYITVIPGGQAFGSSGISIGNPVGSSNALSVLYVDGSNNLADDTLFLRNSDNVQIGGNNFYDSSSTTPNFVSLTGRLGQFYVSSYTGGSTEFGFSSTIQINNSPTSAYTGLNGGAQTGGGIYNAALLTGLDGSVLIQHSAGTISAAIGLSASVGATGAGTVSNVMQLRVFGGFNSGGETIPLNQGIYIDDQTIGTVNYAIRGNAGLYVFNDGKNATSDFNYKGHTDSNLFYGQASSDSIGIGTNSPSSKLTINGDISTLGYTGAYAAKTANYTAATADEVIDCTSNTFNITLPTAVGIPGKQFTVKNSGTGVITIATTSAQTIDGASTAVISYRYDSITIVSDNANWKII